MITLKFILICVLLICFAGMAACVFYISELVARDKHRRDCVDRSIDEAIRQFEREHDGMS